MKMKKLFGIITCLLLLSSVYVSADQGYKLYDGSGDITVPSSTTDNALIKADGTDGQTYQETDVIVDDSNNITGVNNLTLSGAEILADDTASGALTLGGTGGTNNENLTLDFETTANRVILNSGTSADFEFRKAIEMTYSEYIRFNDGSAAVFGSGTYDSQLSWATIGNDNLQLGLSVGNVGYSGYFSIIDRLDTGHANRSPLATSANPVLRIYSADATQANDYIEMYHDQTDGIINVGQGSLSVTAVSGITLDTDANIILDIGTNAGTIIKNGGYECFAIQPYQGLSQLLFLLNDNSGNQIVFGNTQTVDYDHAVQTNPTQYWQSDTSPNTYNNQWGSVHHDKDNFVITTGEQRDVSTNNIVFQRETSGAFAELGRGITDTDITYIKLYNENAVACYLYPNAAGNDITVSTTHP